MTPENTEEYENGAIYMMLLLRPDHLYVTPDGKKLYLLTSDQDDMLEIAGEGLNTMSADELNAYVQKVLKESNE